MNDSFIEIIKRAYNKLVNPYPNVSKAFVDCTEYDSTGGTWESLGEQTCLVCGGSKRIYKEQP